METANPPAAFVAQDLWLAAALIAQGFRLITVEGKRKQGEMSGRLWARFHLEDRPDRPDLVRQYYAGTLACPVAPLRSALNLCRDAMRNSVAHNAGGGDAV
jgi:hypothetical protein